MVSPMEQELLALMPDGCGDFEAASSTLRGSDVS